MAGRRATVAGSAPASAEEADECEEFLLNLTLDGVREGAYMLCKHADDLLGHHARQVFREKAASMRAENSVYYYLKDLMRRFGSQQHAPRRKGADGEPPPLVLEAHEFRKLLASDPAFESAVPSDQVDALFYRIVEQSEQQKLIRHQDFLEFCLLDQDQLRLLLFKYRRHVKKQRLTDNEVADTFKRLATAGGVEMAPELFHAAIRRDLDVVLTTGEVAFLMQLMDSDRDGVVKVNDFEAFLKDDKAAVELLHAPRETGVIDVKFSLNEAEETSLRREGFTQLFPALHDSSRMFLWYRSAHKEEGKPAISSIRYAASSRDTDLVAKGFTCLQQDVNRNGAFGKHKYLWMSFVAPNSQLIGEVIDLSLSTGSLNDQHDARLWMPRYRGFKLVSGNLSEKSPKRATFLWIRRRRACFKEDLVDHQVDPVVESPRSRVISQSHVDELEQQVRKTLRRNCPIDQDCSLNFIRLFEEFDPKKTRAISKQAALVGIEIFGIKMNKKDFAAIWERMNPFGTRQIDVVTFSQFLELTDTEIDEMLSTLQRGLTSRISYQAPNYRLIFQSYNTLGDGKLSRSDFQRIFATNQLSFTNSELGKVIQRFDVNNDGVVDYTDFLKYITGECDASSRAASRVADAAEEIRAWAIERQSKKLAKEGNIDSSAAWKLLKPKHGKVDPHAVDHVLRQRNTRLDAKNLQLLMVLMSPATNGNVSQAALHTFVNHLPKKIPGMVYEMKKLVGAVPTDGETDTTFNRLNLESNGKLPIVKFSQQVNTLAIEKGAAAVDLKDMAYLVQWTGSYCSGDGTVLIDRFLASIRENRERRNMKSEFVTHYDSPKFLEGVSLLREEFKRCAKTPDGKYNFLIPFRLFDKDNSGQIGLSEFEAGIRELGVGTYLSDQEVKGLMRRFDSNSSGAIDYHEFLRFNLAESSSSSRRLSIANQSDVSAQSVIEEIIVGERLTAATVGAYCASLKRMFSIIDKDSLGVLPAGRFADVLKEMSISLASADLDALLDGFRGDSKDSDNVHYLQFCDALVLESERRQDEQIRAGLPPSELLELLKDLFQEYNSAQQRSKAAGHGAFSIHEALGMSKDSAEYVPLSIEDFREVLWTAGVRHPYLRDELESIMSCFQTHRNSTFDVKLFANFLAKGTRALVEVTDGALDAYVLRFQEELEDFLSTGKDAGDRLFAMFSEFDADSKGTISHDEFLSVLQKVGLHHFLPPEDERLLMSFLDTNGDGTVSYQELLDFANHASAKLNAAAAQAAPPSASPIAPPASSPPPPKPESPSKPTDSPPTPQPSPPTATSSSSIVFPREHLLVMRQIWKLNRKLSPTPFPFDKYFRKYRVKPDEPRVKTRVFEKIIDKFLARLVEKRVPYNMKQVDVDSLISIFSTKSGGDSISYENFLNALSQAQNLAEPKKPGEGDARDADGSSSSDGEDDDDSDDDGVSCSSDEGDQPSKRKFQAAKSALSKAIQRVYTSPKELQALTTQVAALKKEFAHKSPTSEAKMFKTLVTLALRLRAREAKLVLSAAGTGKGKYDTLKLLDMIQTHVDSSLGTNNAESKPKEEAKKASGDTSSGAARPIELTAGLADKMYRCFIAAAQHNISGRKLLEKCDIKQTGKVTLLEFQTVLRLMGCSLTDAELEEVKRVLGDGSSAVINCGALVDKLMRDQKAPPPSRKAPAASLPVAKSWTAAFPDKLQANRPAPLQVPVSPAVVPAAYANTPPTHQRESELPSASPMSPEEAKQVDSFLLQFFADLLQTRRLSSDELLQMCEAYDRKGSGFISVDAFRAVMRRCDIALPSDLLARTIISRFTSVAADKFDYVDFCETVAARSTSARAQLAAPPLAQLALSPARTARAGSFSTQPTLHHSASTHSSARDQPMKDKADLSSRSAPSERLTTSLPTLDTDSLTRKPTESRVARPDAIDTGRAGARWTCSVCFHKQTQPTRTCEICAAQDPSSIESRALVQCLACGFRNRLGAITCDLCTSDLESASGNGSDRGQGVSVTSVCSAKIPYDEGWMD